MKDSDSAWIVTNIRHISQVKLPEHGAGVIIRC